MLSPAKHRCPATDTPARQTEKQPDHVAAPAPPSTTDKCHPRAEKRSFGFCRTPDAGEFFSLLSSFLFHRKAFCPPSYRTPSSLSALDSNPLLSGQLWTFPLAAHMGHSPDAPDGGILAAVSREGSRGEPSVRRTDGRWGRQGTAGYSGTAPSEAGDPGQPRVPVPAVLPFTDSREPSHGCGARPLQGDGLSRPCAQTRSSSHAGLGQTAAWRRRQPRSPPLWSQTSNHWSQGGLKQQTRSRQRASAQGVTPTSGYCFSRPRARLLSCHRHQRGAEGRHRRGGRRTGLGNSWAVGEASQPDT